MQSRPTAEPAILLVDDERQTLKYFERAFARDFKVLTANSADEAEAIVDADPSSIGLVISDQRMPVRTGVSLLNSIRRKHPLIIRMLTTAYSELDDAIEAVNRGEIFRYIVKPWNFDLLRQEMKTGLMVYNLRIERDLLVGEKLNVRQRMQAVDRARDLAIIVAGLPELRSGPLAVDDYVRDNAQSIASAAPAAQTGIQDLWSLPQMEAAHMAGVAGEAARVSLALRGMRPGTSALAACVDDAIASAKGEAASRRVAIAAGSKPAVSVSADPAIVTAMVADALSGIVHATSEDGAVSVSSASGTSADGDGGAGATVTITSSQPEPGGDLLLYAAPGEQTGVAPGRLFAAYLAARELGGSVRVVREDGTLRASISIPNGSRSPDVRVGSDWLARLFTHFENWPT
jgi:two-component system probable response regulator PhcQ